MKRIAAVCAALCCFGSGASAFALTISETSDPNVLTNASLGSGSAITILSSSYSGAGTASATYSEGPLGISDGMLLTSGGANLAQPPSEIFNVSQLNNQPGDPLCDALIPGFPSLDAVKVTIQFSLAPGFNGISFQFIFGSDEYPEFAGGIFADVFGVYLDGTQSPSIATENPSPSMARSSAAGASSLGRPPRRSMTDRRASSRPRRRPCRACTRSRS